MSLAPSLDAQNKFSKFSEPESKAIEFNRKGIAGTSKALMRVLETARKVSKSDSSVLITGESGTGKELIAKAIHKNSPRKNGPLVIINCGAIPGELLESELFGHEKGAFTGAHRSRTGRFELADKGTIFLDEIGDMSPDLQVKLLRAIQERKFERVGGSSTIQVDIRVISATNKDLPVAIKDGQFREDLYYRLNVFAIELPPLREHQADIQYLANYYRQMFNLELGKQISKITPEALEALKKYQWPGNVRELRNIILRAVLTAPADGEIKVSHLSPNIVKPSLTSVNISFKPGTPLLEVEKTMIIQTLKAVKGNKLKAANILGISRRSLYNKLEEYQIPESEL